MKLRYFHLAIFPFSATCLVITPMRAELQLTSVITDHAVLQRDAPIHTVGQGLTGGEDTPFTSTNAKVGRHPRICHPDKGSAVCVDGETEPGGDSPTALSLRPKVKLQITRPCGVCVIAGADRPVECSCTDMGFRRTRHPNDPVRSSLGNLPVSVFPPLPMRLRRQDRPHGSHRYLAQVRRRRRT